MAINQKTDALSNDQKNEIKGWLNKYIKRFKGDFSFEQATILNTEIDKIAKHHKKSVVELSIYLKAVSIHMELGKIRIFDQKAEHKILAALRYFIETDDVIPDWEISGYDDDIYCLNIALKGLSIVRQNMIEQSVKALKTQLRFIDGS